jgi:hypothetical protein
MKVWFGCTTKDWKKHREYYLAIRDFIISLGGVLIFDWIPETDDYLMKTKGENRDRDIKGIFEKVVHAIGRCDLSITEYTVPNFSSSHQIHLSLMRQKPTLVLRRTGKSDFKNSYLDALDSPFLSLKEYEGDEYKDVIKNFIGEFEKGYGLKRYNVVLDKRQNYYLSWASEKYSRSKSEILRDLIKEEMESNEEFKNTVGL